MYFKRNKLGLIGVAAVVTLTGCAQQEQPDQTQQSQEVSMEEESKEVQSSVEDKKEPVDDTVVIAPANASIFHDGRFEGW